MTHGAISKQIALLEHWLGVKLFKRSPGGVAPTLAGHAYRQEVAAALDRIASATTSLSGHDKPDTLDINAPPTFTIRWLVPRLSKFQIRHPALEIRLNTQRSDVSSALRGADVVIRRGPASWRGVDSQLFLREAITPVCSPRFLRRKSVESPADLARQVWLYADARPGDWSSWLRAAGVPNLMPERALHFDHSALSLEAAIDGMGVAMGPISMIQTEIEAGTLVLPYPKLVARTPGYYAICGRHSVAESKVRQFRDWLAGEGG